MKKRNWLMTIAFAVLSLTIISTCVIGSTYAKFVSKVSGSANGQAAGFLFAGTTTAADAEALIAPNQTDGQDVSVSVNYFSQVKTAISATSATSAAGNTGAFTAANFQAIVDFYNANFALLRSEFSNDVGGTEDTNVTGGKAILAETAMTVDKFIKISAAAEEGKDLADAFVAALIASEDAKNAGANGAALSATGKTIEAMGAGQKKAITVDLKVNVKWVSDANGGDVFDTLVGNAIYALLSSTDGTEVTLTYGTGAAAKTLTLTRDATNADNNVSKVAVAIGLTATQVVA